MDDAYENRNNDWKAKGSQNPSLEDFQVGFKFIQNTGYSVIELQLIEKAFEKNTRIKHHCYDDFNKESIMEDQYKGLMAVVAVLCKLEQKSKEETQKAKELFSYSL